MLLLSPIVFAYSFSQFPQPFVHDGIPAPNFAIVVGDNAAGSDVLGAIDVALALQAAATLQPAEEETTIQQQQDTVSVGSRSELFAINKNLGGEGASKALTTTATNIANTLKKYNATP